MKTFLVIWVQTHRAVEPDDLAIKHTRFDIDEEALVVGASLPG